MRVFLKIFSLQSLKGVIIFSLVWVSTFNMEIESGGRFYKRGFCLLLL